MTASTVEPSSIPNGLTASPPATGSVVAPAMPERPSNGAAAAPAPSAAAPPMKRLRLVDDPSMLSSLLMLFSGLMSLSHVPFTLLFWSHGSLSRGTFDPGVAALPDAASVLFGSRTSFRPTGGSSHGTDPRGPDCAHRLRGRWPRCTPVASRPPAGGAAPH